MASWADNSLPSVVQRRSQLRLTQLPFHREPVLLYEWHIRQIPMFLNPQVEFPLSAKREGEPSALFEWEFPAVSFHTSRQWRNLVRNVHWE
jgi:hypothetical protein